MTIALQEEAPVTEPDPVETVPDPEEPVLDEVSDEIPEEEVDPPSATFVDESMIDTERMMLEDIDTSGGPLYSISEMAQFFFARSSHWVRWLESCHYSTGRGKTKKECSIRPAAHTKRQREAHQHTWKFLFEGELLEARRTSSGARKYDLALIEKIAHALASNGTIEVSQLRQALLLVKIQAEMFGFTRNEDPEDAEDADVVVDP